VLNPAALHDPLALLHVLLFAFLNNLPKLIGESVNSLVELVLGRLILSQVWELVAEIIEVLDELVELFLLDVGSVHELEVLRLRVGQSCRDALALHSDLAED
jgi:hypothetical protein